MRRRRLALVGWALGLAAAQTTDAPTISAVPTPRPTDAPSAAPPTTAAPSAAPTTSPAPTTAAPTTPEPSAAPTVTRKPTLQPTDKPTWELHASRGWRSGVLDILAKDEMHIAYTSNPMQSSAQCLHGNEMYLPARVLCDRQCMLDGAAVARASGGTRAPPTPEECAGPWYCARTDVCELFRNPEHAPGADAGFDRRCTTIWGCANHSMCFPDEDAAAGMHIDFRKEDLAIKRRSGDRPGHQVCFPASLGCLFDASPSPRRRRGGRGPLDAVAATRCTPLDAIDAPLTLHLRRRAGSATPWS